MPLVLAHVLGALLSVAQAREVRPLGEWLVTQWSVEDGLPVENLNALALGPRNELWIATYDGLYTFDGRQFRSVGVGPPAGVPSPRVLDVAREPGSPAMWVVLEDGSLQRREGEAVRDFPALSPSSMFLAKNTRGLWLLVGRKLWMLTDTPHEIGSVDLDFSPGGLVAGTDGSLWVEGIAEGIWRRLDGLHVHAEKKGIR